MGKYKTLAEEIIKNVGGKENINTLTHCITRLRFKLKDESKANDNILNNTNGVVTVMKSGGQYQVVIGNHVADVYKEVSDILNLDNINSVNDNADKVKENLFSKAVDTVSGIFQPILGVMSACGILKGLNTLFTVIGLYSNTSGNYIIINAIGDALFMFLPIFLGFTSAKKFNLKLPIGLAIGAGMCYPAIQNSSISQIYEPIRILFEGTIFSSNIYMDYFGIPMISMNYTSTVVPVIFIVYFASKVEKICDKIIPQVVKFFFSPMIVIFVSLSVGLLIVGPVTTFGSMIVSNVIFKIRDFSPLLAGAVIGATWQILVIFGMHWALLPLHFYNIISLGADNVITPYFGSTFASVGVIFAILLKTKDKKIKELAFPAGISAIFGITEPAIYGIMLPMKKPFLINCIVAGIVGGFLGHLNLNKYFMGGLGIFAFPGMVSPDGSYNNLIVGIIGAVVSVILSFLITWIIYKDKSIES